MLMNRKIKIKLGDILVKSGKITQFDLMEALNLQKGTGKKLGEVLIEIGKVNENDILDLLSKQLEIERIYLDQIAFDKRAVKLLSQNMCEKHQLIPFGFEDNKIKIAMWDPLNIFAIDDVYISTGYEVKYYISSRQEIDYAIKKYYSTENIYKAVEELQREKQLSKERNGANTNDNSDAIDDVKNAPVVKMIDSLITSAVEQRASDIHIEPFENEIRIRYRIDGQLVYINSLGMDSLGEVVTRIKILSGLNIAEKRLPQDGRIITRVNGKELDLRVSTLPTIYGEKVVIRILTKEFNTITKEVLGMSKYDLEQMDRIIKNPHGIILVSGPTGSGKSTTLYTILNELNTGNINIITIEDPVETTIKGINQVNVNTKAGLTFASGLRSILRQDPDIIMIGEIRDKETAEIAIRAAITGHLVLSTIHTNDAPSAMIRLIDMGLEPFLVSSSLCGVISQRLVRRICPKCAWEYEANEYEKKVLQRDKKEKVYLKKGKGCEYCNNTGYTGRIGIYEVMEVSKDHRQYILGNNEKNIDKLMDLSVQCGMRTLRESCTKQVLQGNTTFEELGNIVFIKD